MKMRNLTVVLIYVFLVLNLPVGISAMGASEDQTAYKSELEQVFDENIARVYTSGAGAADLKTLIKTLRSRYNISYTDEAGILDAIIDRAQERTITREEAGFYFQLLQEGKLMKYRQETYRQRSESYKRELLSLLQQTLESVNSGTGNVDELLPVLNNYYDFVGLEYDEEYTQLSSMILSMKEGRIAADDMMKKLISMKNQLVQNSQQANQSVSRQMIGNINQMPIQSGSQPGSDRTNSAADSSANKPDSAAQKPSSSGSSPRK